MGFRVFSVLAALGWLFSCAHSAQDDTADRREAEVLRLRRDNARLQQEVRHLEDRLLQLERSAREDAPGGDGTPSHLPVVRLEPEPGAVAGKWGQQQARAPEGGGSRQTAKGVSLAPLPLASPDYRSVLGGDGDTSGPVGDDETWNGGGSSGSGTVEPRPPVDSRPSYRLEGSRLVDLTRSKAPRRPDRPPTQGDPVIAQYQQAMASYRSGELLRSEAMFAQLAQEHPHHDYADNALYWRGEAAYDQQRYAEALAAFVEVVERYGGGNKAADALLKIGLCYQKTGDLANAKDVLTELIAAYPRASASGLARTKLAEFEGGQP